MSRALACNILNACSGCVTPEVQNSLFTKLKREITELNRDIAAAALISFHKT